jgi:hypothetical protein
MDMAGRRLTLLSPAFAFTLDASDGLRAVSWENRLTGRILELGAGPEVGFDIGLPDRLLVTPRLRVTAWSLADGRWSCAISNRGRRLPCGFDEEG